jgi:aldose 1-epimerase
VLDGREHRLTSELTVLADEPMPVTVGWHPGFAGRPAGGGSAERMLSGGRQYVRGADDLPTGELTDRRPGPWDDCVTAFDTPPGGSLWLRCTWRRRWLDG